MLSELHLVEVGLCGRAKDGNGSYRSGGVEVIVAMLSSAGCPLRDLDLTGSAMREEEAHALGRGLASSCSLRVLKVDQMVLEPHQPSPSPSPSPSP